MKSEISWLKDALSSKNIVDHLTCYRIKDNEIRATDGCIIASHPCDLFGEKEQALIPGNELEKILSKMDTDPDDIIMGKQNVVLKYGKFKATLPIMDIESWNFPDCTEKWKPIPKTLVEDLKTLRPFISDNATQPWATCINLKSGIGYATNNTAIAGLTIEGIPVDMDLLLPVQAVDFISRRPGVVSWQYTGNYIAFKWDNGAWMRTQTVVGQYPLVAFKLVADAAKTKTTQVITPEFRKAYSRLNGLVQGAVKITSSKMSGTLTLKGVEVEEAVTCEVPKSRDYTLWGVDVLAPVIEIAESWSPGVWPNPSPFKAGKLVGVVVGRVS